jgi:hypothetical protein
MEWEGRKSACACPRALLCFPHNEVSSTGLSGSTGLKWCAQLCWTALIRLRSGSSGNASKSHALRNIYVRFIHNTSKSSGWLAVSHSRKKHTHRVWKLRSCTFHSFSLSQIPSDKLTVSDFPSVTTTLTSSSLSSHHYSALRGSLSSWHSDVRVYLYGSVSTGYSYTFISSHSSIVHS